MKFSYFFSISLLSGFPFLNLGVLPVIKFKASGCQIKFTCVHIRLSLYFNIHPHTHYIAMSMQLLWWHSRSVRNTEARGPGFDTYLLRTSYSVPTYFFSMLCEFIPPLYKRSGSGIPLTCLQCIHYNEKLHTHIFSFIHSFSLLYL